MSKYAQLWVEDRDEWVQEMELEEVIMVQLIYTLVK